VVASSYSPPPTVPRAPLLLLLLPLAACDRDDSAPRAVPAAPIASVARVLGVDAGELEPETDPLPAAGDMKAELDAFSTVDACVGQRAAIDPLVGDALQAIGYDSLVRDACRVLDAAKARDARRCEGIEATTLRARCQAVVAAIAGEPDTCPWDIPGRPERGREAACLALATRDPRLCGAAFDTLARTSCAALAAHDAAPCKSLVRRADQQRCARDVQRWSAVLPAMPAPPDGKPPAPGTLHVEGDTKDDPSLDAPLDVSRGVVVLERIDGAHFVVGALGADAPAFAHPAPGAPPAFGVELVVPADTRHTRVERLELAAPHTAPVTVELSRAAALQVKAEPFERRRGGVVEVDVAGRVATGMTVKVHARTFVRDVVKASALMGAPRFGDAGFLR